MPQNPPRTAAVAANFPDREARARPGLAARTDRSSSSPPRVLTASTPARPLSVPVESFTPTWRSLEPGSPHAVPVSALNPPSQELFCPSGSPPSGESQRRSGPQGASCSRHPRSHRALNWGCPARSSQSGDGLLPPRPETPLPGRPRGGGFEEAWSGGGAGRSRRAWEPSWNLEEEARVAHSTPRSNVELRTVCQHAASSNKTKGLRRVASVGFPGVKAASQ